MIPNRIFYSATVYAITLLGGIVVARADAETLPVINYIPNSSGLNSAVQTAYSASESPRAVRNNMDRASAQFRLNQILPSKLWLNGSAELSQRLDTNVALSPSRGLKDYVGRVLPNITIGYQVGKNTSIYGNYFLVRDRSFAQKFQIPTTNSLGFGIRTSKLLARNTELQLDLQARELWQTATTPLFDLMPSVTITRLVSPNTVVYGNVLMQLRGTKYFQPGAAVDPYYTWGCVHRRGLWTLSTSQSLITNYGTMQANYLLPGQTGVSLITDVEINRPVSPKHPELVAFMRAEPVWSGDKLATQRGTAFDFRLYSGLRWSVSKSPFEVPGAPKRSHAVAQVARTLDTNYQVTH